MSPQHLIVGLGNPGLEYSGTRHNIGFDFLDALINCSMYSISKISCKWNGDLWRADLYDFDVLCLKPSTFMNRSGDCVQPVAAYYKIDPSRILVIHDDLDLIVGRMKFKIGGGNAGHNGLKSIEERLATPNFARLRLGIGHPPDRSNTIAWVLGHPSKDDKDVIIGLIDDAKLTIKEWLVGNLQKAISICNGHR